MKYIFILIIIIPIAVVAGIFYKRKNCRNLLEEFRKQWGKPFKLEDKFSFDEIAIYHNHVSTTKGEETNTLGSAQIRDLNLHELFKHMDRTISLCGQQYMYHSMLRPTADTKTLQRWDNAANFFEQEKDTREKVQLHLASLKKRESYFLPGLFLSPPEDKTLLTRLFPLLNLVLLVSFFAGFMAPPFFLLIPLIFLINMVLHYAFKKKFRGYMTSFKSLHKLFRTVSELTALNLPWQDTATLQKASKAVKPLQNNLSIISIEPDNSSDIAMFAGLGIEYLKILFLLDLQAFYGSLKQIKRMEKEIHFLFRETGFTDSALALASFRKGLPVYCIPDFSCAVKHLEVEEMYHPLVKECIPNSLSISGKGILITGSNMSGKTTCIRSLAICTLLGQAFCTCTAATYRGPRLRLFSSIQITDDLSSGKSYYFKELERILKLVRMAEQEDACLFVIDECFKGTNTLERIAAAREVLAYLNKGPHIVLIATHDIELSQLLSEQYELYHFNEVVTDESLNFDFKIKPGLLQSRNAIRLLELNGYPAQITEGARRIADSISFTAE